MGRTEREIILDVLSQQVAPLARSLPGPAEVVLHDLSRLPRTIVAIEGSVTGRREGDPATDMLLEQVASGTLATRVGYRTTSPEGRELLSTTVVVRDGDGEPVAALCLNRDVTDWQALTRVADTVRELMEPRVEPSEPGPQESFVHDVDELAALLLHQAVAEQRVPVELMRKEHKVGAVRTLKRRGFFLLRDAVETAAQALGVTRFTIYNYLNEIDDAPGEASPAKEGR